MWTRSFAVLSLLAVLAGRPEAGAPPSTPVTDEAITHALNRLTFGPRAGDLQRVRELGLQHWIDLQLSPSRIDDGAVAARLGRLATLTLDSQTIQREYAGPAMMARRERQRENPNSDPTTQDMLPPSRPEAASARSRRSSLEPGRAKADKDRQVIV